MSATVPTNPKNYPSKHTKALILYEFLSTTQGSLKLTSCIAITVKSGIIRVVTMNSYQQVNCAVDTIVMLKTLL